MSPGEDSTHLTVELKYSFLALGSDSGDWLVWLNAINPGFSSTSQLSPCKASGESLGGLETHLEGHHTIRK